MESTVDNGANWGLIGHEWAVDFLRRGLLHQRSRHAYLITGAPSLGKMTLALAFAMALNCEQADIAARPCGVCRTCRSISQGNNPDLIVQGTEAGKPLKIDAIRHVARLLALQPYASRYRIAIFDGFDLAPPLAQDALLKTMEEPASYAVILLLANSSERLLPTIRSRAQTIPLRPLPLQLVKAQLLRQGCAEELADLIARQSAGRIGWALAALEDEEVLAFRQEMLDLLRDILAGARLARLKASEQLSRKVGRDKALLRDILEIWTTFWRDVLLSCYDSPVKPCNSDRMEQIRTLAARVEAQSALQALTATQGAIASLNTNANIRLLLDALMLDFPGLD